MSTVLKLYRSYSKYLPHRYIYEHKKIKCELHQQLSDFFTLPTISLQMIHVIQQKSLQFE